MGIFDGISHDGVIKWKHFPRYWSFVRGIHQSPVNPPPPPPPPQRPVTRSFDVFFDLCLNKRLSKQSWGWWFETPSRPLWRHNNVCTHGYTTRRLRLWLFNEQRFLHYDDVIMMAIASQITSLTIVYSAVYSGPHQRKHQSSASLAFVQGIHRGPVNSPHKWPVTRKMFPFDDVIMSALPAILQ